MSEDKCTSHAGPRTACCDQRDQYGKDLNGCYDRLTALRNEVSALRNESAAVTERLSAVRGSLLRVLGMCEVNDSTVEIATEVRNTLRALHKP